jgi:hypothetical protein
VNSAIVDVDFSKDGNFVATGNVDGVAHIWDAVTGNEVISFPHEGAVLDVDFNQDGAWLATGSADGTARIWSTETGEQVHVFVHGGAVGEVSLRSDGSQIATASLDKIARIWDIATEAEFLHLEHPSGVTLVNFISETNWLVTVSQDNAVRFWDDTTGDLLERFFVDSQIRAIEISSDGSKLAVTGEDNVARVWEILVEGGNISLNEVSRVVHLAVINDVVYGAGGNQIATASNDRTVLISLLIPEELIDKACSRVTHNFTQLEWTQFFEGEVYQLTCPNLPPDPSAIAALRTEVGRLGAEGNYVGAVDLMRHIQELDSSIDMDIAVEIRQLTIETILSTGITMAQEGVFEDAYLNYSKAQLFDGIENFSSYEDFLVNLCYVGGTEMTAGRALPICNAAIASDLENRLLFEARARSYAWLGNFEGAIEDLNQALELIGSENLTEEDLSTLVEERREWIEDLESGNNPFTEIPPS